MEPYQFIVTDYDHPEREDGPKTEGSANVFVRQVGTSQWYKVNGFTPAAARRNLSLLGWDEFTWYWCTPVME